MAEANNSNPSDKFNLETTAHEKSQVNQVGQIIADTVIFGTAQRTGKPFQAPPLPTYYVDRPEYSQDLKKRLLTQSNDVRTLVVTAIHGLGSVGKSTLATALAHDQEVQTHFCDGILWATLGQQPNLLSLLSGWVQALDDYNFKATSVEAASTQLRTLLYDKAVLLVVDDAWNTEDAQAFNVGGARCQVLVTTRDAAIAHVLRASTYSLDVMTPEQAIELLTKKLGRAITGAEHQSASDLAKAIGYLPLALELVAAEVASGTTWTQLLEDFQQEIARLKTLDRPEAEEITDEAILKRFSLTASLNLSVKRMPKKKQEHFSWLGVLPEDVTITKMMATTLWKMDVRDTAKTLQYLQNKALLLSGVTLADGTPTYRLHDLFHDLARNLLTAPPNPKSEGDLPGLGITLTNAHATFMEKYRQKTQDSLWHTLPNDGYIHQHLVWHLEKAEKVEEIHSLLREESKTGANGWYEACDRLGQTANFVTDVARAWQLAESTWTLATLPQVIGLQCRYALIIASLNSLAANLPIKLLLALIEKNVWTPEQGLAYVLQSPNPIQKVYSLTKLANHLPPNLKELGLSKALTVAWEIPDKSNRARALISLADKLPELLPEALAAAREIPDEQNHADALISLADKLPELLPEALAAAREIPHESNRTHILRRLTDKLPELLPEVSRKSPK
ncbi:MAG: NB-ARC domain-containing protein [Nostoc sp.]|uniref:NB-ARC domain-containing protein n=1 Tax=Nostoc sp. TaxID=1180 RepID=UPI002FFD06B8